MQKLIQLKTKALDTNGDRADGYINSGNAFTYTYTFEIDHDQPQLILKESIENLYEDIDYNMSDNTVGTIVVKKGTKFHFTSGVKFPRQQFKELQQAHGVKSIRDIEKADYIIIDNNLPGTTVQQKWKYGVIKPSTMFNILYFLDEAFIPMYKDRVSECYKQEILDNVNEDHMFELEYSTTNYITYALKNLKAENAYEVNNGRDGFLTEQDIALLQLTITDLGSTSKYYNLVSKTDYKILLELVKDDISEKLVNTDLLSKVIDKHLDKVVLDEEQYQSLVTMFKSNDKDNHIIAMEIMANCHFKDSLLYIEKLFLSYAWVMWDTGKANHVNFKNLRTLVDRSDSYSMKGGRDFDHSMKVLQKFGIFTPKNINFMLETHLEKLNNLIYSSSRYFNIKSLTLNEECLNKINFNYIYTMQEDHIPKKEEIKEEIEDEQFTID